MVVEVLLNVDDTDIVLREQLSNTGSVCCLITGNIVTVQGSRKTSDIECEGVERAGGLGNGEGKQGRESVDGSQNGMHLELC